MPIRAGSNPGYEFLDQHAEIVGRLLSKVRSVAFFDAQGQPLRVRGVVSTKMLPHVRRVLERTPNDAGSVGEIVVRIAPEEYVAVLALHASDRATMPSGLAGICALIFHELPESPQTIREQLSPALKLIARDLAQISTRTAHDRFLHQEASELDWLLEISARALPVVNGSLTPPNPLEQASGVVAVAVGHLGCSLGALLVPGRQLRVVHTGEGATARSAEEAMSALEGPLLNWVRRKNQPMLVNRGGPAGAAHSALRLLVVPVVDETTEPEGVLVFIRSTDEPEFSPVQLSVVKHLSRYMSALFEAEIDSATGLHTKAALQRQVEFRKHATGASEVREALREDRLTLFAQKITPLQGQREGGGYELLLRSLETPDENHAPATLLSAALRHQLAPHLDLWVIEHAITEAALYSSELLAANVSLSINITAPSLTDEAFLKAARNLIRRSRLAPSLITFEITETVAVLSLQKAVRFIRELRAFGCRFALDDFGTGVNSLKNLTSLPVDRVKIDGSFVSDILSNHQSTAMVRAIVSLARDLGISTVAEYAWNKRTVERLRELGVHYAQGYGVDKPRPFADVLREFRAPGVEDGLQVSASE